MVIDNSARGAPQENSAQFPNRSNGCRRVTLEMQAWHDRADSFKGLPAGTAKPLKFLYAFKEAEPYLRLPAHTYKLVDWLVRLTKPQDWEEGSRPIAWPEARRQAEFLGVSPRAVQMLNRALQEAGIFVMRDDPQGRRYGYRDPKTGRITKAFGFDLSLLMERHEEFKKIAAEAEIERNHMKKLRQRKTLVRKAIDQAAEELAVQGYDSEALQCLLQEKTELVETGSQCDRSDQLALVVKALERRRDEIHQMLRNLIKSVETSPMGEENCAHSTSTTLNDNNKCHTVITTKHCSRVGAPPVPETRKQPKPKHLFPESLHITPATLVELAPRLAPYMPVQTNDKGWPEIVEAARYLSGEMGINQSLWGHACDVMGREYTAVALALVSTRAPEHFTKSAGSYFGGMVKKFEENPQDLCLSRTIWRLKEQTWGKEGHKERREVERQRRIEERTKKSVYRNHASAAPSDVPRAMGNSDSEFRSVGAMPLRPAAEPTPPVHRAPMATPAGNVAASVSASSGSSRAWRPTAALLKEARQVGLRMRQSQQHYE